MKDLSGCLSGKTKIRMLILVFDAGTLFGANGIGFNALVGDLDGIGHLLRGRAGEGAVEPLDIDPSVAHLGIDRLVHGGEKFVAELVEELVDVDVGHSYGLGVPGWRVENDMIYQLSVVSCQLSVVSNQ